ncbi:MAG: hypothetical protein Q9208_003141 [Pyrenodesmia sp. 3 TL-2023]
MTYIHAEQASYTLVDRVMPESPSGVPRDQEQSPGEGEEEQSTGKGEEDEVDPVQSKVLGSDAVEDDSSESVQYDDEWNGSDDSGNEPAQKADDPTIITAGNKDLVSSPTGTNNFATNGTGGSSPLRQQSSPSPSFPAKIGTGAITGRSPPLRQQSSPSPSFPAKIGTGAITGRSPPLQQQSSPSPSFPTKIGTGAITGGSSPLRQQSSPSPSFPAKIGTGAIAGSFLPTEEPSPHGVNPAPGSFLPAGIRTGTIRASSLPTEHPSPHGLGPAPAASAVQEPIRKDEMSHGLGPAPAANVVQEADSKDEVSLQAGSTWDGRFKGKGRAKDNPIDIEDMSSPSWTSASTGTRPSQGPLFELWGPLRDPSAGSVVVPEAQKALEETVEDYDKLFWQLICATQCFREKSYTVPEELQARQSYADHVSNASETRNKIILRLASYPKVMERLQLNSGPTGSNGEYGVDKDDDRRNERPNKRARHNSSG